MSVFLEVLLMIFISLVFVVFMSVWILGLYFGKCKILYYFFEKIFDKIINYINKKDM